jgi:hypothetical protein
LRPADDRLRLRGLRRPDERLRPLRRVQPTLQCGSIVRGGGLRDRRRMPSPQRPLWGHLREPSDGSEQLRAVHVFVRLQHALRERALRPVDVPERSVPM